MNKQQDTKFTQIDVKLHCWKGNTEYYEEKYGWGSDEWAEAFNNPATCFLANGHKGEHRFIPDNEVMISFANSPEGRRKK